MPAEQAAVDLWENSPVAAVFAVVSLVAVGVLAFGAAYWLAPTVWHGDVGALGVVRAALTLLIAFVAGPLLIFLLASAFRRLAEAWQSRR